MSDQQPTHGAYGSRYETTVYSPTGASVSRTFGNERWCSTCRDWVQAVGIVSLVLGSVGCPKCGAAWPKN